MGSISTSLHSHVQHIAVRCERCYGTTAFIGSGGPFNCYSCGHSLERQARATMHKAMVGAGMLPTPHHMQCERCATIWDAYIELGCPRCDRDVNAIRAQVESVKVPTRLLLLLL